MADLQCRDQACSQGRRCPVPTYLELRAARPLNIHVKIDQQFGQEHRPLQSQLLPHAQLLALGGKGLGPQAVVGGCTQVQVQRLWQATRCAPPSWRTCLPRAGGKAAAAARS
jgi:hypothetical protein